VHFYDKTTAENLGTTMVHHTVDFLSRVTNSIFIALYGESQFPNCSQTVCDLETIISNLGIPFKKSNLLTNSFAP
jgi:hypothetical protein